MEMLSALVYYVNNKLGEKWRNCKDIFERTHSPTVARLCSDPQQICGENNF